MPTDRNIQAVIGRLKQQHESGKKKKKPKKGKLVSRLEETSNDTIKLEPLPYVLHNVREQKWKRGKKGKTFGR